MTLETLLENSVKADFALDASLSAYPIRGHDYGGAKGGDDSTGQEEALAVVTVTATDQGEFKTGSGINRVLLQVEVRYNGAADNFSINASLLDSLSGAAGDRLQQSSNVANVGREDNFSTSAIKVFGILRAEPTPRLDEQLERIRTIARTFIVAQLAS